MSETKKRSTVVRTLRIPTDLVNALEAEAEDDGTTLNSISTAALIRHVKWDRNAEKFGVFAIPTKLLAGLLNAIDDGRLVQISEAIVPSVLNNMAVFWGLDGSIKGIIGVMQLWGEQGLAFDFKVTERDSKISMVIRHDLGRKFSLLLASSLNSLLGDLQNTKHTLTHDATTVAVEITQVRPPTF